MATTRPRRADAQRNRDRILEAALVEFSHGSDVSLSAIAKRAGVGQATMYRNFPDRDALILAVYHREVEQLVECVPRLLKILQPDAALREWLSRLAKFAVTKAGFGDALGQANRATGGPKHPGYARIITAVELLLDANRQAGTARDSVSTEDFMLLIAGVWQLRAADGWETRAARLLELVMDGLRPEVSPT